MAIKKIIKLLVDTGDAKKDLDDISDGVDNIDEGTKKSKRGFIGLTGGVKMLSGAFKAMGIGLIIAAFVKLKDLFSGNMETARKFERAGARVSAMFDVIRDRLEPLFEKLMSVFTDPKQAIKDLWQTLKENIANRIEALIDTFKAFGKVIKGVFTLDVQMIKEGASDAADSFVQLATGLDDVQQGAIKNGIKSVTKELNEEGDAADRLTLALQKVRDMERGMLGVRAEANKIIAESRLLAEDDTKSNEERLEALKAAVAEEERVAQIEMDIQQEKIDALQGLIDLGKSSEEDIQKLAEERARLTELQTASILRQKRVAAEVGVFTAKVNTDAAKKEQEKLDRAEALIQAQERGLEVTEEMTSKEINAMIKTFDKEQELEAKSLDTLESSLMSKEELELKASADKFQKLIDLANKYGQDTTELEERLRLEQQAIRDKFDEEELKKEQELQDAKFNAVNSNIDKVQAALSSLAQIRQEQMTAEQNALEKQLEDGIISEEQFEKKSAKIAEEALKREKRNAKFQILIDTAQGIAAAIKAGAGVPFPANLGAILSGIAAVVAGIAQAKAVMNKVPGGGGGGDVDASTGAIGGIGAGLLPNMNVLNPPTGDSDMQPVQAFVVETDISNAQALQEELEIQATL
tara:strand:+ start:4507 stop:6417 length:1911 start_codon:yes stop_codon:yes gene_type:complete